MYVYMCKALIRGRRKKKKKRKRKEIVEKKRTVAKRFNDCINWSS